MCDNVAHLRQKVYIFLTEPSFNFIGIIGHIVFGLFIIGGIASHFLRALNLNNTIDTVSIYMDFSVYFVLGSELFVRLLTAPKLGGFVFSFYTYIDLLGILPVLLELSLQGSYLKYLMVLVPGVRALRVARLTKEWILIIIISRKIILPLFLPLLVFFVLVIFFGCLVHAFSNFTVFESFRFVLLLFSLSKSSVDFESMTVLMLIISLIISYLALVVGSLTIGIVSSAVVEVFRDRDRLCVIEKLKQRLDYKSASIHEIRSIFDFCDKNGSGTVDIVEFETLLNTEFRLGISKAAVVALFETICKGTDDVVAFDPFCKFFFPDVIRRMRIESAEHLAKSKLIMPSLKQNDIIRTQVPFEASKDMIEFETSLDCLKHVSESLQRITQELRVVRPAIKALLEDLKTHN